MQLVKDLGLLYPHEKSKRKVRYGIYKCPVCKKDFKVLTASVKNGSSTKCRSCATIIISSKHNGCGTRLYNIWSNMKARCSNTKLTKWINYGGRGISVCPEWHDFSVFKKWADSNGYDESLSIDRIDNNGNYEPDNCRWTTSKIQNKNQRLMRKHNTSGYRGVSFDKSTGKFLSYVGIDGSLVNLGLFNEALDAAKVRDRYVIKNNLELPLNFNE